MNFKQNFQKNNVFKNTSEVKQTIRPFIVKHYGSKKLIANQLSSEKWIKKIVGERERERERKLKIHFSEVKQTIRPFIVKTTDQKKLETNEMSSDFFFFKTKHTFF